MGRERDDFFFDFEEHRDEKGNAKWLIIICIEEGDKSGSPFVQN
jgi:hypothetical protein